MAGGRAAADGKRRLCDLDAVPGSTAPAAGKTAGPAGQVIPSGLRGLQGSSMTLPRRAILHVDMDAFYASVE
ncbi:MAG: hypothetical protein ACO3IN_11235, partial [Steroidobacteraceae bacterium]